MILPNYVHFNGQNLSGVLEQLSFTLFWLPVGFLLLRYSVLFTVESLSLLNLLVISCFICSRRGCIDKLGFFHANQISMCLDSHLN